MTTITITERASGAVERREVAGTLDDAKAQAEALTAQRGGLNVVRCTLTTDRGKGWQLAPRERNTGPGRFVWHRI